MKPFITRFIRRSHQQQAQQGQGIVEYLIILALVGLAVVLIVNLMGPAISNVFADIVERAPVGPPELVGFTRVPPTPTATLDPNPTLSITYTGGCGGTVGQNPSPPYVGGDTVTLTAVPDAGCEFTGWGDDLSGDANPETIYMDADKTVSANFSQIRYTLTINVTGAGTVHKNPDQATFLPGEVVQLTAVPDTGLNFLFWNGDLSGSANPIDLLMDGDKTVDAFFPSSCYTLIRNSDPPAGGAVNPSPGPDCESTKYTHGVGVALTANPSPGYAFSNWSGDNISGSTNPYPNYSMIGNRSVTAHFTQLEYTLTLNASPTSGGVSVPVPNQPTYHYGDTVQITAATNPGYTFSGWSGSASGSANPYILTFDGNETVTANFTADCYTLTLDVLPNSSGTVSRSPASSGGCPSGQYAYDTWVTLTANPANGYTFQNWSGAISGNTSPGGVTIHGNTVITANFQQCYALNITINPSGTGSVTRNPTPNCAGGATYSPGTLVNLTAAANTGYDFANWSGDATGTSTSASVTMNGTRNVTANYSLNEIYDGFESNGWTGGYGWAGDWAHQQEATIDDYGPHSGTYYLLLVDNGEARRAANLSGV
ncbi:MAG: InlB B-repeat-containing protein, partial [Anaerolineales bacterium]|nr:InlB B-repeat-containing protein [Anaerolineales bacterium]